MSFTEVIGKFLHLDNEINNGNVEEVFDNTRKEGLTADAAYRLTRFGAVKSDKTLLKEFFDRVTKKVSARNSVGKFFCFIDVDIDIVQFLPEICKKLRNELGFKVIVMNNESIIKNNNQEIKINGDETFIMLFWSRDAIAEVKAEIQKEQLDIDSNTTLQNNMTSQNFDMSLVQTDKDETLHDGCEEPMNEVPEKEE